MARRAVEAVLAELGPGIEVGDLLPIAARGAHDAAASFDPQRGLAYEAWALLFTAYRLWEQIRRRHAGDGAMLARARLAMFRFMAHHQRDLDPWTSTRETSRAALQSFSDGLLSSGALAALGAGGAPGLIASRGEEDVTRTEGARRAGEAVRQVMAGLRPEQRSLLQQCAAYGTPVTVAARQARKRYKTLLDDYHDLLALCGARLSGLGIKEMPPWQPDISGQVFDEPPEPSEDDSG